MRTLPGLLLLITCAALLLGGCGEQTRAEIGLTPDEQVLIAQITRDPYLEVLDLERNDLDQLVVTTRQGSQRVRYVLRPEKPGDPELRIHRVNDRAMIDVSESEELGTGPQPGFASRYR